MYRLLARLRLANSNLWKDPLKLSLSSQETKISILSLLKTSSTNGWKEMTQTCNKIAQEEKQWLTDTFKEAVNQEKQWAEYLFKDGSMIGLNEKLLSQYVEWIANRRMKAIGLDPIYDIAARNNPLPWTQHWISSKGLQVAPQETEVESYIVGGIKQDVKKRYFLLVSNYDCK